MDTSRRVEWATMTIIWKNSYSKIIHSELRENINLTWRWISMCFPGW